MHLWNPHSLGAWNDYAQAHPTRSDTPVLENNIDFYDHVRAKLEPRGPVTMLDCGPGGESSILRNTCIERRALNARNYISMDCNPESAVLAKIMVAKDSPDVVCDSRILNFYTDDFQLTTPHPTRKTVIAGTPPLVCVMDGNTLGNIIGPIAEDPAAQVVSALKNFRRHMQPGDYLILGLNQNRERETSYDHPLFMKFQEQLFPYLNVMLPQAGFQDNDFKPFMRQINPTNTHVLGYTAQRNTSYKPKLQAIRVQRGEDRYAAVSRRYTDAFVKAVAGPSGFKHEVVLHAKDRGYPWKKHALVAV
jgi:uncharacterized SAM-dependent methyltransferase